VGERGTTFEKNQKRSRGEEKKNFLIVGVECLESALAELKKTTKVEGSRNEDIFLGCHLTPLPSF